MSGQALVYSRISSDPEGRAIGVERQEADCHALAERYGYTVAGVYRDNDVSASTSSTKPRPGFNAVVDRVRQGEIAAVLAYSNSRLTRRVREYLDLIDLHKETGVLFRTVVSGDADLSTADGRGVAITLATWDAAEAERTAERVRRAKRANVEQGTYRGGPRPLGYEADGVTLRTHEADAIRAAAAAVLDGSPLTRIADQWEALGIRSTRTGRAIPPSEVGRYLRRARNAGLLDHKGTLSRAGWPAIIDRGMWEAVCAVLDDPARRTNNHGGRPRWLLTGIAVCGVCERTMKHGVSHGLPFYRCAGRACTTRRQDLVDQLVHGVVAERLRRPDLTDLLHAEDPEVLAEAAELRRTVTALEARLDALAADTALLSERMLGKRSMALEAELDAAATRLDALNAATASAGPVGAVLNTRSPADAYLSGSLDLQRAVVGELLTVTFLPGRKGRPSGWRPGEPYFDPESVDFAWRS